MDLEDLFIDYVTKAMTEEWVSDQDCDPIFIAAIAAVVFYTDYWRWRESRGDGGNLPDKMGIAITDTFVTEVLAEQAEHEDDFESFREKHPTPAFPPN